MSEKSFIRILVAIIIVVVIGVVGFFAFLNKSKTPDVALNNQNQTSATPSANTSTQTITPDETIDWQTYRNDKYGFEFKYPKSVTFKDINPHGDILWKELKENTPIKLEFSERTDEKYDMFGNQTLTAQEYGLTRLALITDNLNEGRLLDVFVFEKTNKFQGLSKFLDSLKAGSCEKCSFDIKPYNISGNEATKVRQGYANARGNITERIFIDKNNKIFELVFSYGYYGLFDEFGNFVTKYNPTDDGETNLDWQRYTLTQKILQTFKFL